mmetsp:Transcript_9915/g.23924  ORF Transcript_9915/g.23924 Transcript_9915/m.23924 type:complete len:216 (-) Transcript_9915:944-1591(-)
MLAVGRGRGLRRSVRRDEQLHDLSWSRLHVELEVVLLIAALVGVRHEVQGVVEAAGIFSELNLELHVCNGLADGDSLDRDQCALRTANHQPPDFLLLLRVIHGIHRADSGTFFLHGFSRKLHRDLCTAASCQRVGVLHLVLQGNAREAIAGSSDVSKLRLRQTVQQLVTWAIIHAHDVEDVFDFHLLGFLHHRRREVGQLHKGTRCRGCGLHHHL